MEDKTFIRGLFSLIAFLLVGGVIMFALITHNWWLILGENMWRAGRIY